MAYESLTLETPRGPVRCRHYRAPGSKAAVVMVGGVGGDFDSPAVGLYPRLCTELSQRGLHALRVDFRHPTVLRESLADLLEGLNLLAEQGVRRVALIGHSFGGAVVLQAAEVSAMVETVITLAAQTFGTQNVSELCGCSVLLIHGEDDRVLPVSCSQDIHARVPEPKRLVIYPGAGHSFDEVAQEVHDLVLEWLQNSFLPDA